MKLKSPCSSKKENVPSEKVLSQLYTHSILPGYNLTGAFKHQLNSYKFHCALTPQLLQDWANNIEIQLNNLSSLQNQASNSSQNQNSSLELRVPSLEIELLLRGMSKLILNVLVNRGKPGLKQEETFEREQWMNKAGLDGGSEKSGLKHSQQGWIRRTQALQDTSLELEKNNIAREIQNIREVMEKSKRYLLKIQELKLQIDNYRKLLEEKDTKILELQNFRQKFAATFQFLELASSNANKDFHALNNFIQHLSLDEKKTRILETTLKRTSFQSAQLNKKTNHLYESLKGEIRLLASVIGGLEKNYRLNRNKILSINPTELQIQFDSQDKDIISLKQQLYAFLKFLHSLMKPSHVAVSSNLDQIRQKDIELKTMHQDIEGMLAETNSTIDCLKSLKKDLSHDPPRLNSALQDYFQIKLSRHKGYLTSLKREIISVLTLILPLRNPGQKHDNVFGSAPTPSFLDYLNEFSPSLQPSNEILSDHRQIHSRPHFVTEYTRQRQIQVESSKKYEDCLLTKFSPKVSMSRNEEGNEDSRKYATYNNNQINKHNQANKHRKSQDSNFMGKNGSIHAYSRISYI